MHTDFRTLLNAQCDLYQINFPRFVCSPGFLAEQAQRIRLAHRRPFENGIFVLEHDHELIGFVWVAIRMDLQGSYGSIDQLYLKSEYRRQGLGRLLLEAAHEYIRLQGVQVARLYVTVDNHDAVQLYSREGYGVKRLEMEKPL